MQSVSLNPLTHYQTTNFRLFQSERVCRRQFQILTEMAESYPNSVFKRLVSQGHQKVSLCGNGLKATFQLSSAAYLNLGRSKNGVFGNRLNSCICHRIIPPHEQVGLGQNGPILCRKLLATIYFNDA